MPGIKYKGVVLTGASSESIRPPAAGRLSGQLDGDFHRAGDVQRSDAAIYLPDDDYAGVRDLLAIIPIEDGHVRTRRPINYLANFISVGSFSLFRNRTRLPFVCRGKRFEPNYGYGLNDFVCRAFDSFAPAHSVSGLPVYVARCPPAPFCERPFAGGV
jgi:hypothetical protein